MGVVPHDHHVLVIDREGVIRFAECVGPGQSRDPAVWIDASPSQHVGEGPVPAEILIVTRGRTERIAKAQSFADQFTAAGSHARVVDANPLSHADVNKLIAAGNNEMSALMIDELAACSTT